MSDYSGRERRIHKVYRTRNTEYHLKDGVCVGVRDRRTNEWRPAHIALRLKLEGGVKIYPNGACVPNVDDPRPGDAIFFNQRLASGEERQIVTSRVETIDRPPLRDVRQYGT